MLFEEGESFERSSCMLLSALLACRACIIEGAGLVWRAGFKLSGGDVAAVAGMCGGSGVASA